MQLTEVTVPWHICSVGRLLLPYTIEYQRCDSFLAPGARYNFAPQISYLRIESWFTLDFYAGVVSYLTESSFTGCYNIYIIHSILGPTQEVAGTTASFSRTNSPKRTLWDHHSQALHVTIFTSRKYKTTLNKFGHMQNSKYLGYMYLRL
jgi:hypothetical protein